MMKKTVIPKILFLFTLIIGMTVTSCKKEPIEVIPDPELPASESVLISFTDPATGVAANYTIGDVIIYVLDQPVVIALKSPVAPTSVEVVAADGSALETLTVSASGAEFISSNYSTTIEELGLNYGGKTSITLKASYPVGEGVGVLSKVFTLQWGEMSTESTGVQLIKQSGDAMWLSVTPNLSSMSIEAFGDELFGYSFSKDINKFLTIDAVEISDGVDILDFVHTDNFSVSLWIKSSVGDNGDPVMFGNQDWSSSNNPGMTMAYKGSEWKTVIVDVDNATDSDGKFNERTRRLGPNGSDIVIDDDVWHLITFTLDRGGNGTLYQDGVEFVSVSAANIGNFDSGLPFNIGQDGTGAYTSGGDSGDYYDGRIANVEIYDYVLSAEEVAAMTDVALVAPVMLVTSDGTVSALAYTLGGGAEVESYGAVLKGFNLHTQNDNDFATIDDAGALDFMHTANFSYNVWIKSTVGDNGDPVMFGNQDWTGSSNVGMTFAFKGSEMKYLFADGTNKFDLRTRRFGEGGEDNYQVDDSEWHMLTVTVDRGGVLTVYQDGAQLIDISGGLPGTLVTKDMTVVTGTFENGLPFRIGQDGNGTYTSGGDSGNYYEGIIAGTTIYDYVLTADDVAALYGN